MDKIKKLQVLYPSMKPIYVVENLPGLSFVPSFPKKEIRTRTIGELVYDNSDWKKISASIYEAST